MNTELLGVIAIYALALTAAIPLGRHLARVFSDERSGLDRLLDPLDRLIYRLSGIRAEAEMSWQQHLKALLTLNLSWFLIAMFVLSNMGWLPLNPDGNPSMSGDLAFNTAVSFITNTNLQHYSGETALSYLGQLTLMLWQFISAATGMAICGMVFRTMQKSGSPSLGNFYRLFVRSLTRVLLPLALAGAVVLAFEGSPMTFEGKYAQTSLEGDPMQVSRGPVAAFVAIKQLGTNGGGFYGPNSTHPLENPSYLSNVVENVFILLIPVAMIFAFGHMAGRRLGRMVLGVMTAGFLLLLSVALLSETGGNPALEGLGIAQESGSMEGKEQRFGPAASALWAVSTTCTSNGSVNAMHDSMTPLSGMAALLGMMVNVFYGGVGVGFLNFYLFLILSVFISGLMVGRTPEFLGRKIEAREMKIAMIVALLHPLLILAGTALASYLYARDPASYQGWLANPGFHGFSEMLYEFSSSAANNGSGFEGLGDNTLFWNIACGVVMLIARYLPIIGPVAIAGLLAQKSYSPEGLGTLRADSLTFGILTFAVIWIIAALSFFPALVLGPIAEYVTLYQPS